MSDVASEEDLARCQQRVTSEVVTCALAATTLPAAMACKPSIEVRPNTNEGLELGVWLLEPGETEVVARRVRQVLRSA